MNPSNSELLSLAKRLIAYETCEQQNIVECAGFVEAWLEARDIEATRETVRGLGLKWTNHSVEPGGIRSPTSHRPISSGSAAWCSNWRPTRRSVVATPASRS